MLAKPSAWLAIPTSRAREFCTKALPIVLDSASGFRKAESPESRALLVCAMTIKPHLIGYARVSKGDEQSNALQLRTIKDAGCKRVFEESASGGRWDRPPRGYRPSVAHILKFCRRNSGGKQYKDIEAALDRLAGTRIKIVNLSGGERREVVNMPLIQAYHQRHRAAARGVQAADQDAD